MTKKFLACENYLDPDVAYLLGMIVGRGSFTDSGDNRRLVIEFPYRALYASGISETFKQKIHLQVAVNQIRDRIQQLVDAAFSIDITNTNVRFIMRFMYNSMAWRNLRFITESFQNYRTSTVPPRIFDAPADIQREFVRGLADVCGFVRTSNKYYRGRHRVYIEIPGKNWRLPITLCRLLQVNLGVSVQMIQWNHPNTRIPTKTDSKLTGREHQIKIFAEAFQSIGFHVDYKQTILDEFANFNKDNYGLASPCNPNPEAHPNRRKPDHPEENSNLIPKRIRGRHFDAYWQICSALGCTQCRPINPD